MRLLNSSTAILGVMLGQSLVRAADRIQATNHAVKDEREDLAEAITRSKETRQQRRNRERLARKGRTV